MKGCLIVLGCVVAAVILVCCGIAYYVYSTYANFPEYAKREVVYKKYEALLDAIDETVKKSNSILDLAANLEKIDMPDELIYLALEKTGKGNLGAEKDLLEILKKFKDGSVSRMIMNGAGYGRVDGREVIIIEYEIKNFDGIDQCILYLKHTENGKNGPPPKKTRQTKNPIKEV